MKTYFKITSKLLLEAKSDLLRPHPIVHERVGFLSCFAASTEEGNLLLLASDYTAVDDDDYEDPGEAGVKIGRTAIRKALQLAHSKSCSIFHVHMHLHNGKPRFSKIDNDENHCLIPNFWNIQPKMPHGAIVLSNNRAHGECWHPDLGAPTHIDKIFDIGSPLREL